MLEKFGMPYYLKIDIEGADLHCVRALPRFSERPKYVSLESTMTSSDGLLQEFGLLRDLGYVRFKLVNQLAAPAQVCPFPAREGRYVEHRFVHGSSGMFGDEAPGDWLTYRKAVGEYRKAFLHYRLFGNDGVLSTFNWERPLIWRAKRLLPGRRWYDTHASR
jgi:hypothetical protein